MTYPAATRDRIIALYGQTGSSRIVRQRTGLAHSTVLRWLREAGVPFAHGGDRRSDAARARRSS